MSTCIKHSGSVSVFKLITADISDNDKSLLDDIFTRINGLERRLQVSLFQIYCVEKLFALNIICLFFAVETKVCHVTTCTCILIVSLFVGIG